MEFCVAPLIAKADLGHNHLNKGGEENKSVRQTLKSQFKHVT